MVLLADSGSTKTDWRLLHADGSIDQARSAGFNPYYQNSEAVAVEVAKRLRSLVAEPVSEVFFYGAGITDPARGAIIADGIRAVFPEIQTITCESDMLGAARALCGRERGLACILGTGANTCLSDGGHIVAQVRSLGFWLGDEGSGGYLGKTLVTHFLHNELPGDLDARFRKRFPDCSRETVLEHAYRQPFPNRYFAGFSKFLFDHRQHAFARDLVTAAFRLFFEKYVEKYQAALSLKIHFTGSVAFYYNDLLRQVATERGLTLGIISENPIAGLTLYHAEG
ncbi:MAG: N-acetylglucosamine kinase [Sphingobacteriaceae bacterium]|nr:N-acetylglucosamine kinase [Cytophagaceae bacterium]